MKRRDSQRHARAEPGSTTDSDTEAGTRHRRRRRRFGDSHYGPETEYQAPSVDDRPLPAMYFEPTVTQDYQQPSVWTALGCGMVQNRGVQNVPSMTTIGVQYSTDQTGTALPTGTVPAGFGVSVPPFYGPPLLYGTPINAPTTVPMVGGEPTMVVSGSTCPLCGRQDYHVHPANSRATDVHIVPQLVSAPGHTTLLTRCKHFTYRKYFF